MRTLIIIFIICLGIAPALAQTSLTLSVTGTNVTQADQVAATLSGQSNAATAAAAQAALNRLMGKALATAKNTAGVSAVTGTYNVAETDSGGNAKPQFQARQDLTLTMPASGGNPPAAFTQLAGQLQADGLLMQSIGGSLSAKGEDAARAAATVDGIHRLQTRAQAVAQALGDVVGGITTLSLNSGYAGPVPMRAMVAMAAAPAPEIAPGPITVTVNIEATVALKPPGG
jgi:uncharacterized protein YggE